MVGARPNRARGGALVRTAAKNRRSAAELLGLKSPKESHSDKPSTSKAAAPRSASKSEKKEKVRVWWAPTRDKNRTGFSGAYWPAVVKAKKGEHFLVQYDNGDEEKVHSENIFPYEVPLEFGEEEEPLQVGEFVEVSNGSKTDPCAWVGCLATIGSTYKVAYPFHDTPSEHIKPNLLRRARVFDQNRWKYIEAGQKWKSGEVTSPLECNLLKEKAYFKALKGAPSSSKKYKDGKKHKGEPDSSSKKNSHSKKAKKAKQPESSGSESSGDSSEESEEGDTSNPPPSSKGAKGPRSGSGKKQKTEDTSTPAAAAATAPQVFPAIQPAPLPQELGVGTLATFGSLSIPLATSVVAPYQAQLTSTVPTSGPSGVAPALALDMNTLHSLAQMPGGLQMFSLGNFGGIPGSVSQSAAMPQVPVMLPGIGQGGRPLIMLMPGALPTATVQQQRPPGPALMPPAPPAPQVAPAPTALASTGSGGLDEAGKKKKKDPNAPKKAMSAFEAFKAQARDGLMAANDGMLPKEANARLKEMWDQMGDEEKGPYKNAAKEDKERFNKEMETYHPDGEDGEHPAKRRKRERDPDAPVKAKTAYILFIVDYRKQLGKTVEFNEATKLCAEAWKNAPEHIKDHYKQLALQEKFQYERKKADYEAKKMAEAAAAMKAAAAAVPQQPVVQLGSNMLQQVPMQMGQNQAMSPPQMPVATAAFPAEMAALLSAGQSDKPAVAPTPPGMVAAPGTASPFAAVGPAAMLPEGAMIPSPVVTAPAPVMVTASTGPLVTSPVAAQGPAGSGVLVDQCDDLNETLSRLDMQKVKDALKRYYTPEAYMLLLDAWRRESVKVQDAIMSYKSHVADHTRPDWRAFMVRIFGLERMKGLEKPDKEKDKSIEVEQPKAT